MERCSCQIWLARLQFPPGGLAFLSMITDLVLLGVLLLLNLC